jgi:hypothetical protein
MSTLIKLIILNQTKKNLPIDCIYKRFDLKEIEEYLSEKWGIQSLIVF